MKIKVYGYYDYDNTHDNREHLTVTPIKDIEGRVSRDYSGNVYEFELNGNYKYGTKYDKCAECELAYLIPDFEFLPPENTWTNLGNLRAHKVKE